ncbi:hypothetical protein Syun_009272 [Stephania yunnanensis]|uniref:Pentatricopeptide repeat-containing protein n=1 Tax=Stephania yunnanensis TaxID=152371 RepID=A0AAP0KFV4_9MAGN
MYAQNGELKDAHLLFDKSPPIYAVSYTAMITGYVSGGCLDDTRKLFDEMPNIDEKGNWVFGDRALTVLLLLFFVVRVKREVSVKREGRTKVEY